MGEKQREPELFMEGGVTTPGKQDGAYHICMSFSPGTSKWNKIEHKMFSYITRNWCGRPLISHEVIINLVANTRTGNGLNIRAELDSGHYEIRKKASDEELQTIKLKHTRFHGDWSYSISTNI
jgi:hypothetical protein